MHTYSQTEPTSSTPTAPSESSSQTANNSASTSDNQTFADRLHIALNNHGYKWVDLARYLDLFKSQVSRWKTGTSQPNLHHLTRILTFLPNTDARWLITGRTTIQKPSTLYTKPDHE